MSGVKIRFSVSRCVRRRLFSLRRFVPSFVLCLGCPPRGWLNGHSWGRLLPASLCVSFLCVVFGLVVGRLCLCSRVVVGTAVGVVVVVVVVVAVVVVVVVSVVVDIVVLVAIVVVIVLVFVLTVRK